jgi:hypothetical protein
VQVLSGQVNDVVLKCGKSNPSRLMTLGTKERTLDLQVPSQGNGLSRDQWVELLVWVLDYKVGSIGGQEGVNRGSGGGQMQGNGLSRDQWVELLVWYWTTRWGEGCSNIIK